MKKISLLLKKKMHSLILSGFALLSLFLGSCGGTDSTSKIDLEAGFINPPDSTKAHTWYHWMNGNITKEGITLDLKAMKRVGISGFHVFNLDCPSIERYNIPPGKVDYLSPLWLEMIAHTANEADRLDMEFGMHNSPGYSSTGGPWVTPDYAMQQLVWTETNISGGTQIDISLFQPLTILNYYRDVCVLAFPAQEGTAKSMKEMVSKVTVNGAKVESGLLTDGDVNSGVKVAIPVKGKSGNLTIEFAKPYKARSLLLYGSAEKRKGLSDIEESGSPMTLEASDDGVRYRKVCNIKSLVRWITEDEIMYPTQLNFPITSAKFFRIVTSDPVQFTEIQLSGYSRIESWTSKSDFTPPIFSQSDSTVSPALPAVALEDLAIDPAMVKDISQYMDKDGQLKWHAPEGQWTIMRIGHTAIDMRNVAAPTSGKGLEIDKYSAEALDFFYKSAIAPIIPLLKPLIDKHQAGITIDSYEVGMQTWTAKYPEEFLKRRGYDIVKYLPALTGRIVGNPEITDRFLYDIRRTNADLMKDNYYGHFTELCHRDGLKFYIEPYTSGPFEEFQVGMKADIPLGEFWQQGRANSISSSVKLAASVAHANGKKVVGAESFTSISKWTTYPYALRALGDYAFTQGVNRFVLHRYAMQPHPTAAPGMTMGPWGWHFERTNTWFEQSAAWLSYLQHAQYLLQQGLYVADLAYFTGMEVPSLTSCTDTLKPALPKGYSYDYVNADVILKRMKMKDGQMVLNDGMSYRVLVMKESSVISLELLQRIKEMLKKGLWLIGPKPVTTPGLSGYQVKDEAVKKLADEIWADVDGNTVTERGYGKGRIFYGVTVNAVLEQKNLKPDFEFTSLSGEADINYIHRAIGNNEVYLVANSGSKYEDLVCTFRIEGKQPEYWDAETGRITSAEVYKVSEGRTIVPVQLNAGESVFVVFRKTITDQGIQSITKDGKEIVTTNLFPVKAMTKSAYASDRKGFMGILNISPVAMPDLTEPPAIELVNKSVSKFIFWQNGDYVLTYNNGQTSNILVTNIGVPVEINGQWKVTFPPNLGAPTNIQLEKLISWTDHPDKGIKYFSGTATYTKTFPVSDDMLMPWKRLYLDLGHLQVLAEVSVNGKSLGILWMPPFRVDITDAAKAGENNLEIKVTNLWPNRLIGDEQLPPENEYNISGGWMGSFFASIIKLPEWYVNNEPKPVGGRITFTTWKHWNKNDKLFESGLIGPVILRTAFYSAN